MMTCPENPSAQRGPAEQCPRCGAKQKAGLGSVPCAACLVKWALTPDREGAFERTETWAPIFPHLELEELWEHSANDLEIIRARDLETDRAVWLVVAGERRVNALGGADVWRRSYQALRQLNDQCLARVLDFGDLGECFYIVLEAHDGEALDVVAPSLEVSALEAIVRQVTDAVTSARLFGVALSNLHMPCT